ncbi:hypothetical protein SLEP1_g51895 [Rubroshorea leprosula]|uniref:Uncharacterized protein n=1 Tax=Rubroshorea leprosula TaxID=152421 RepID=A0AAV5M4M4_9ROSI|nr:hypothetical protein SLEP1_g51895 [Rubroshorea leprosula]
MALQEFQDLPALYFRRLLYVLEILTWGLSFPSCLSFFSISVYLPFVLFIFKTFVSFLESLHWVSRNLKPIAVDFDFALSFVSSPSNLINYSRKQSREVGGVVELQP